MSYNGLLHFVVFVLGACDRTQGEMEGFVVGGHYAAIRRFPHSAFLAVTCVHFGKTTNWICGGSILNQQLILTAAHCLEGCFKKSKVSVSVGAEDKDYGHKSSALSLRIHEDFNTNTMWNDIALVYLRTEIRFGPNVKRVAISRNPPYMETAYVAGFGVIDEDRNIGTQKLKQVRQTLWTREECNKVLNHIPVGAICAGAKNAHTNFASSGDSGSALMVRDFIQVGIVSYKLPRRSHSLTVYTEVKYFYDWIIRTSTTLHCKHKI